MAETPTIKLPSRKDVEDYFNSQGLGSTNQPTRRQMMGIPPEPAPPPEPKDEWERLARMAGSDDKKERDAFKEEAKRIPMHHDYLLTLAADDVDKYDTLQQLYGEGSVRGLEDGSFLVRKLDKKTGKEKYFRTDEKGLTMRDASDFLGGLVSATPEIAGWVKATSYHASKFPQHPYTKMGLLGITATGMAASELAGAAKDAAYRKFAIKKDVRALEILKRRGINFAIGLPLGWGLGRLTGGGKFTPTQIKQYQKMLDEDPALFVKQNWDSTDDLIAQVAKETAERLGIEIPGAATTLATAPTKSTRHMVEMAKRIPGMEDPMRKYELSLQRSVMTGRRKLTGGPVDYPATGQAFRGALRKGEEQLRHWSQGEATKAVTKAEETALSQLPPMAEVGAFDAKAAGDKLRTAVQAHAKRRKDEVEALYADVETKLAIEGVVEFVNFHKLAAEINKWRTKRLPKVLKTEKTVIPPSEILDRFGKPATAAQTIITQTRKPIGKFSEASKQAEDWIKFSETPQSLQEAQYLISDLGEITRAGTIGKAEGSIGFAGGQLNKFYRAAKADLDASFDALKVSDDLKGQWGEANLQHAMKVDELNKSSYIQSALRAGKAGGKEVESAELLTHLIGGTSPATRKAELKLLQGMLEPAEYEELRQGLLKQMVGLNFPTKITNTTGLPYIQPTSGRVVPTGEEIEIVNLGPLMKHLDAPGNLGFLKEIFGGERQVNTLKAALKDFKEMQELHGMVGRNAGIEAPLMDDLLISLKKGDVSDARAIMRNAIGAEKDRKRIYLDLLDEAYRKNDFALIAENPTQFVDDVILGGGNKTAEFGKTLFKELPDDVKDQLRRATADRIIIRTSDIVRTPTTYLRKQPGDLYRLETKADDFLKMLYEDPARQTLFKQMFPPGDMEVLNDFAAMMQVYARMKQIAGGAGSFAVETAMGGESMRSLITQAGLSKALMSDAGQTLMSRGQVTSGTGLWAWAIRLINSVGSTPQSRAEAAKQTAINLEMGINPARMKMAMALDPPTANELRDFFGEYWKLGFEYAGGDKRRLLGWESTFGIPIDNLPSDEEIKDFMEQELKKKQDE